MVVEICTGGIDGNMFITITGKHIGRMMLVHSAKDAGIEVQHWLEEMLTEIKGTKNE